MGGMTEGGVRGVTEDGAGNMMEDRVGVSAWAKVVLHGWWARHDGCGVTERGWPVTTASMGGL